MFWKTSFWRMSVAGIFIVLALITISCREEETNALDYYNQLARINNEVTFQLHLTIKALKKEMTETDNGIIHPDSLIYLRNNIDSVITLCRINREKLRMIGPYEQDSILMKAFIASLNNIEMISTEELSNLLDDLSKHNHGNSVILSLYNASMKLADDHQSRIQAVLLFNAKYGIEFDTTALAVSRDKTLKFSDNITLLHNSVPLTGNCVNGFGQLQSSNGTLYTGEFRDGLFDGYGKLEYPDGSFYEGHFRNGSFHGKGLFSWKNGMVYKGEWREDKFNGIGTLITSAGDSAYGYWVNGVLTDI